MVDRAMIVAAVSPVFGINVSKSNRFATEMLTHQSTLIPTGQAQPTAREISGQVRFLQEIARTWDNNPNILDSLSAHLDSDPALKRRFQQSMIADRADGNLNTTQAHFRAYAANPSIETLRRRFPEPAAAAPAARAPERAEPRAAAPSRPTPSERREETSQRPEPATAAAAPVSQAEPLTASASTGFTAEDLRLEGGILDIFGAKMTEMFPDMANDVETFKNRIRANPELQERIATNFNNNPEFMTELMKLNSGEGGNNNTALLQQFGRQPIQNLLSNPEQLASDSYVDGMTQQLKGAGGGIGGMLQNLMGGLDLGGIGGQIMGFLQPLMDMLGNLMRGFGSGNVNVMSMGNGNGNLMENFFENIGRASREGAQIGRNEEYVLRDPNVRAVDRNNDGVFNDADKIDVNGQKVYELSGLSNPDGNFRVYASRVNERGQVQEVRTLAARDGTVTRVDEGAGANQTPPPPAPANVELANNRTNNPAPGGVDMAPSGGLTAGG